LIGKSGHGLVYGGADIGLMGAVADAAMESGAHVIGVIPSLLVEHEIAHRGISELIVVGSMHERKKRMADHADAFIALPGGWGTLEELAEMLTWRQLRVIHKPIGLLNTAGFYDPLIQSMGNMVSNGFLKQENLDQLIVAATPEQLFTKMGLFERA